MIRLIVLIVLGLHVRHRKRLPRKGRAIIVANHNSHLYTIILMSLFPLRLLPKFHPVAAMDCFLGSRLFFWFSLKIIGILPIKRKIERGNDNPPAPCNQVSVTARC